MEASNKKRKDDFMKNIKKIMVVSLIAVSIFALGGVMSINLNTKNNCNIATIDPPLHPW